jgi:lysophospholipase L1-like esterase
MHLLLKRSAPALALLGLALGGCQPDLDDSPKSSAGQADFSRYIAVGNSLTAGYSDNGLYLEGQQNSYPAILAGQFAQVGGGAFVQPLFPAANAAGSGYLKIAGFNGASPVITSENGSFTAPSTVAQGTAPGSFAAGRAYASATSPLLIRYAGTDNQNLGVPGIRIADITTADYGRLTQNSNAGNFNPYFERLLSGAASSTYLDYVLERVSTIKPTFFTNWLGNNDVLGYASSGGTAAPLTPVADFTTKYTTITNVLTSGGAKGLVATIPNVVNVPFFTTVPTATVIAQINATPIPTALEPTIKAALGIPQTSPLPTGLRFGFYITAGTGSTATKRLATPSDLLLLTAQSAINVPSTNPAQPFPSGVGLELPGAPATTAAALANSSNALASNFVLDATEVSNVQSATTALNAVITSVAAQKGLAVFDSNTFFNNVARAGLVVNTVNNTAAFISGNLFSLDGVHPTPRGYAVVANEMIKSINATYGAQVPGVDATKYRGVQFPN